MLIEKDRHIKLDYNLLVVDDEEQVLRALQRQLRNKYRIFAATDAEKAEQILQKEDIEVILSDQRMPGMNGSEFFRKIKDIYPDPVRMMLTGYSDISAVIEAINEGNVFRYIKKPWDPAELEINLEDAFERFYLVNANKFLVDELKHRNEQLDRANIQLEELLREKTEKLNVVQYELDVLKRLQEMF